MKLPPKPPRGFTIGGFCGTGQYRIRPLFIIGLPVLEELYEYRDGTKKWRRCTWPESIELTKETRAT